MITVAETAPFLRKIDTLLSSDERADLIAYLAEHPNAGVVMQGTGGIRKLRWARQGGGKSGGIRVIYYFHSELMPLYLLAAFGKNEKANLSAEEKHLLAKTVKELVTSWRYNNGQGIH
ncbi:MAG: type II toxin-antitoxin system RelE/ParE family toxin [Gammaproteobacteria bacterium]|nr:type II toxin-antitoxin system RelE/ParE family toxin [Gammaproteobacteria bacterium]MCW8840032.1 type II toxin-antitoxin system RelE/ParE family toxin [Gammaproteobacteria bacterium]MCW8958113.1 type II toxin-antitoxin system RelE/ParE family toxin [Gammaproteobacteria bacterium]MCW8972057.1 type II toxin-antitoxin system RelE/ParE family toxin [Gammaproteobacteria bacterium]MCW8993570.1 type II toxin-antitoxin system RelE/ParE family toxin [Gammaproteobacteria bacterium]